MKLNHTKHGLILILILTYQVQASALADLKKSLSLLVGESPISTVLTASRTLKIDDDITSDGHITLQLTDDHDGFQIRYGKPLLAQLETEITNKSLQEKNKTADNIEQKTLDGMSYLKPVELRYMLSNANQLNRFISQLTYLEEQHEVDNHLRVLHFSTPMEVIVQNKKTREYVDKFEGKYKLWINEQGIPIKSSLEFTGKGSAYLIFSLTATEKKETEYQVVNQRLVIVNQHSYSSSEHTFGRSEFTQNKSLTFINNALISMVKTQ
jgi:hypothetical protein